ncbi:MAG: hypothetical protein FWH21_09645, partial [Kiritimatiellaeota bacterium]|nr:hypothetical protein [Kiritimatiellota bacterium]
MKKLLIGFMLMVVSGSTGFAQTNFYTNVTNLWYQGGKNRTNVLTIANTRLAANTNDFAGLLLKAHYSEITLKAYRDNIPLGMFLSVEENAKKIMASHRDASFRRIPCP